MDNSEVNYLNTKLRALLFDHSCVFFSTLLQVRSFVLRGDRLPQPTTMPPGVYAIVSSCWNHEPSQRPDFKSLQELIHACVVANQDAKDFDALFDIDPPQVHDYLELKVRLFDFFSCVIYFFFFWFICLFVHSMFVCYFV